MKLTLVSHTATVLSLQLYFSISLKIERSRRCAGNRKYAVGSQRYFTDTFRSITVIELLKNLNSMQAESTRLAE
jgi:hypothetical protein